MALDEALTELLVDPEDKQPLQYIASEDALYNPRLQRVYSVTGGIPVLLIGESRTVDPAEHERLTQLIATEASVTTGVQKEKQ